MGLVLGIMFAVICLIAIAAVHSIDYMHTKHPEYKGEDLFEEGKGA
jgi:hypothetical protein